VSRNIESKRTSETTLFVTAATPPKFEAPPATPSTPECVNHGNGKDNFNFNDNYYDGQGCGGNRNCGSRGRGSRNNDHGGGGHYPNTLQWPPFQTGVSYGVAGVGHGLAPPALVFLPGVLAGNDVYTSPSIIMGPYESRSSPPSYFVVATFQSS
jgi:hypothetical protein